MEEEKNEGEVGATRSVDHTAAPIALSLSLTFSRGQTHPVWRQSKEQPTFVCCHAAGYAFSFVPRPPSFVAPPSGSSQELPANCVIIGLPEFADSRQGHRLSKPDEKNRKVSLTRAAKVTNSRETGREIGGAAAGTCCYI